MEIAKKRPTLYLTNKELLAEIQRCKASFCYFTDDAYAVPDGIVNDLDEVTEDWITAVCARRSKERSPKGSAPVTVAPEGLVVRLMTFSHIPLDSDRKRKPREKNTSHAAVNFPPFRHYRLSLEDGANRFTEVGRSHWVGGLDNGWFDATKGRVTNRMGRMYQELVRRYGRRGNWVGYSYNDEMQAAALVQLCQVGLQFDESKSSNPFSYFTTVVSNVFTRVFNIEKKVQTIRDDLLELNGAAPSMTRQLDAEFGPVRKIPAKPGRPRKITALAA